MQNINIEESCPWGPEELENNFEHHSSVSWVEGLGSAEEFVTKGCTAESLPTQRSKQALFRLRRQASTNNPNAHRDMWNNDRGMVRAHVELVVDHGNYYDDGAAAFVDEQRRCTSLPCNLTTSANMYRAEMYRDLWNNSRDMIRTSTDLQNMMTVVTAAVRQRALEDSLRHFAAEQL